MCNYEITVPEDNMESRTILIALNCWSDRRPQPFHVASFCSIYFIVACDSSEQGRGEEEDTGLVPNALCKVEGEFCARDL